jgi:tetratricopeptide (TPR) repeat protein
MTARTYMVVDDRRDHSFRVPRPDLTAEIGTPNACDDCHGGRDAAWATAAISTWRGSEASPRPQFATALHAGRQTFANAELLKVVSDKDYPGIARATAVTLLAQPFGSQEFRTLEAELGSPDPLIRIAALRQLRALSSELRLRLAGSRLLADPVRGVRIEAVATYAGMQDLLPVEDARAYGPAEREFRQAYGNIANRPEALVTLATFEIAEGNVAAAIALYETALRIEPRAVAARANLADALRGLNQEPRAQAILREGLALDENNPALRHALGLSLVRSGRREEALAELRRAAQLAPENPRFAYVLAIALNSMDQRDEALGVLRGARERFDGDFEIAMVLATILRDSGDQQGALDVAYGLARRHPEEPNVLALLRSLGAVP